MRNENKTQRIGCFEIPMAFVQYPDELKIVRAFFQKLDAIIWKADYSKDYDALVYMAISDMFDEIPVGESAPHYPVHRKFKTRFRHPLGGANTTSLESLTLGKRGEKMKETFE